MTTIVSSQDLECLLEALRQLKEQSDDAMVYSSDEGRPDWLGQSLYQSPSRSHRSMASDPAIRAYI